MNKKLNLYIGAVVLVLVAGVWYDLSHRTAPVSVGGLATTTPSTATSTEKGKAGPKFNIGEATVVEPVAFFDEDTLVSTSTYPVIRGTASVPKVDLIIYNSKGVGIVGSSDISVVDGHWTYSSSVALTSGSYILSLFDGKATQEAVLLVR